MISNNGSWAALSERVLSDRALNEGALGERPAPSESIALERRNGHFKGFFVAILMPRGGHFAGHLDGLFAGQKMWFFTPGFAGEDLLY